MKPTVGDDTTLVAGRASKGQRVVVDSERREHPLTVQPPVPRSTVLRTKPGESDASDYRSFSGPAARSDKAEWVRRMPWQLHQSALISGCRGNDAQDMSAVLGTEGGSAVTPLAQFKQKKVS